MSLRPIIFTPDFCASSSALVVNAPAAGRETSRRGPRTPRPGRPALAARSGGASWGGSLGLRVDEIEQPLGQPPRVPQVELLDPRRVGACA